MPNGALAKRLEFTARVKLGVWWQGPFKALLKAVVKVVTVIGPRPPPAGFKIFSSGFLTLLPVAIRRVSDAIAEPVSDCPLLQLFWHSIVSKMLGFG